MKWSLTLAAVALACGSLQAIETMDETMLENLHLEGLDAPAAGELRTAVAGDVSSVNAKNLQKDLDDVSGVTSDDTAVDTSAVTPENLNDSLTTRSQDFERSRADVSVQRSSSADRSSSESLPKGLQMNISNTVNLIGVEKIRPGPESQISAGSIFINNLQVDTQIRIQER
jgi:hypothetical protein